MKESVDKIIHSTFIHNNLLVVINAHNFVEVWDMRGGSEAPVRKSRQFSEEECILYSGDFNEET